jgi:hypothetical protein
MVSHTGVPDRRVQYTDKNIRSFVAGGMWSVPWGRTNKTSRRFRGPKLVLLFVSSLEGSWGLRASDFSRVGHAARRVL